MRICVYEKLAPSRKRVDSNRKKFLPTRKKKKNRLSGPRVIRGKGRMRQLLGSEFERIAVDKLTNWTRWWSLGYDPKNVRRSIRESWGGGWAVREDWAKGSHRSRALRKNELGKRYLK